MGRTNSIISSALEIVQKGEIVDVLVRGILYEVVRNVLHEAGAILKFVYILLDL